DCDGVEPKRLTWSAVSSTAGPSADTTSPRVPLIAASTIGATALACTPGTSDATASASVSPTLTWIVEGSGRRSGSVPSDPPSPVHDVLGQPIESAAAW